MNLAACDLNPYHGFGCIAPESHPAVAHARSLSADQLETLHNEVQKEIQKLNNQNASEFHETEFFRDNIPDNLRFLNPESISINRSRGAYIVLANCYDERIELRVSPSDQMQSTIALYWTEPTNENPWASGKQVLWQTGSES